MRIRVEDKSLIVESERFTARLDGGVLTSLVDRGGGVEFCRAEAAPFALELYYVNGDTVAAGKALTVEVRGLSEIAARVIFVGEGADRELFIHLDAATGDLCVRPSGHGDRRGLRSAKWNVPIAQEAGLVLPCNNGMEIVASRDHTPAARSEWPSHWQAQLVIAERDGASMMIHSEDTHYKYKALSFTRDEQAQATLGFEGDWRAPADRYREWMDKTYGLTAKRADRPDWVENISLAVSWASSNPMLLDSLAKVHPPDQTLIHLDQWRTSRYDVNYPEYLPTDETKAYLAKANSMGFKVMPHFNYFGLCKGHPLYDRIRDWHVRDVVKNDPQGWFFPIDGGDEYYRMAYIHAGLATWRRELIDNVVPACDQLSAPAAFLDQTYHTWNCDQGIVESLTMVEGLAQLQEEFACIRPQLVLAGECLHEIAFQRQAFAQTHPMGWGNMQPKHVEAAHPICSYLWSPHTTLIGYIQLEPWNERIEISIAIHRKTGVLPTFVARERSAAEPDLLDPAKNPVFKHILDWAAER